jgi:tetratricopeptide (TPR) repeat protein
VLHGRFSTDGWLDDLDESIARHRKALARQVPTAPVFLAILSNLGLALQDCCIYRDDDAALDEAIALHERAASACPPGSPDRAGYLATLAAGVQLRFERDHLATDLSQVISLDEQALACLDPRAPERATVLASLAAARHLHARDTADPADFDNAIGTYQAALRRLRASSPARPLVLGEYARALGDHPARHNPAIVLRTFRTALTASGQSPLVRLDVASSLGEWALRNRLWQQAADAYHAAAGARRALFGAQPSRTYRNTWLAHGQDITAAEASAWAHCGQPQQAAAALDAGRALALSEVLDASTITIRLRALDRHELADRYEMAALRLSRVVAARSASIFTERPGLPLPGP